MLEIGFRKIEGVAILDLEGNIDIDSSSFIERIGWCLENGYNNIIGNFEDVNFIDYAGLSVLAIACKNVFNHKGNIKLIAVPPHIKKIFCMVGLDKTFEVYDDEDSAIKSFKEDKAIHEIQGKKLRRRFKRIELDIDVGFKSKKEISFHYGKLLNLSAVGFLVWTDKIYPLGEILNIKLLLSPKPGWLEINAKVVWHVLKEVQPHIYPGMGLEFHNLSGTVQEKIVDFVERNLPLNCSI